MKTYFNSTQFCSLYYHSTIVCVPSPFIIGKKGLLTVCQELNQLNPSAINHREPSGKTMLIKCSTPDAKIQILKMIQWQDIKLPNEWFLEQESPIAKPIFDELDLTHIQQYLDGTVKISFQNNQPLRIKEGRHSFAGFESISKRDQDLNEFLKRIFQNPLI